MNPVGRSLAWVVRLYQLTLRAVIGGHCRFEPSCSHYAMDVLCTHGALRGMGLASKRILRCNPWHPGGYDPAPAAPLPPLRFFSNFSKGRTAP